ncbi:MAG: glycosyltransferase family 39 protein, partial [Candidatus Omnitrophota bacterium]
YYDMPILTTPPLLSCALMISHNILEPGKKYMIPVNKWKPGNKTYTASQYTKKQFYAVVVPLLFSCLLILFVFLLGKNLFGFEAATWAAFLMVICPTDILTSQKVWADGMTAFFVVLTVFLFVQARKRDSKILSALSGISAGLGATAKPSGGFIVFAIVLYYIWISRENILNRRWKKFFFDKHLILFLLFGFLAVLPWYGLITKTYGKPWYRREAGLIEKDAPWFKLIHARSKYIYLVNIPAQTPILFLTYFIIIDLVRRFKEKDRQALLFFWMAVYLRLLWGAKEQRYMLPAIPAAAIISGYYLHRIRAWLDNKTKLHVGKVLVVVILVLCALWSIPFGRSVVLRDGALIRFPF